MPRKANKRNISHINKQKKAIATRLIQISLLMDDYVYKHKEISEREAELYILEISSYDKKCIYDPRSLQVIEKLTKFMKAIITKHKEIKKKINNDLAQEITSHYICKSPVYSLADEDDEHLTQLVSEGNNVGLLESNDCAEIKDLCEESNNKLCNISNNSAENDVCKPTFDSIVLDTQVRETFAAAFEINNSQSTQYAASQDLFNADTHGEKQVGNINLSQVLSNNDQSTEKSILNNCGSIENEDLLNTQTQIVNASKRIGISSSIMSQIKKIENEATINFVSKFVQINYLAKANYSKPAEKAHKNLVDLTTTKISDLQSGHLNVPNCMFKPSSSKSDTNFGEETKNKKVPRKKKNNVKSQENAKTKEVKRKPKKKKDVKINSDKDHKNCSTVTWNENINKPIVSNENSMDLSWMENIKYVREISTTESHTRSKDLRHDFWENFSLPHDWDENDFLHKI